MAKDNPYSRRELGTLIAGLNLLIKERELSENKKDARDVYKLRTKLILERNQIEPCQIRNSTPPNLQHPATKLALGVDGSNTTILGKESR